MQNKKLEWCRLGLYLLFANGIAWIPWFIIGSKYGSYAEWAAEPKLALLMHVTAFSPAIANVLTRLITKEGWHDSLLHLRWRNKGVWKYYAIGVLFPLVCALIGGYLQGEFVGGGFSPERAFEGYTVSSFLGIQLFMLGNALAFAFYTFGEEFGWRGYMNQKLDELTGTVGTVLIGGFFWGVWHAPLTMYGHNFGTGYRGFPWMGIVVMCAWCTGLGAMMHWINKKTGSVYPSSISHAALNFATTPLAYGIAAMPVDLSDQEGFWASFWYMLPAMVLGMVFFVLLLLDERKKRSAGVNAPVSPEIQEEVQPA